MADERPDGSGLDTTAQMVLASTYALQGLHVEAIEAYAAVERQVAAYHARSSQAEQRAMHIRVAAMRGRAAVLRDMRQLSAAVDTYVASAALAKQVGDARMELDCYRLACRCAADGGQRERAWTLGLEGLQAVTRMIEAERTHSTLPCFVQQLTELFARDERAPILHARLDELLGTSWRAQLA